ncbi:hypothetical protein IEO21_01691 [Rhodonia placenta]|uniref:Uncharacterized protein n=1 Tax=Rhodonia placenta TaxID=104341 RepID=A0A8H7P9B4_9APHY|nr:hypothetical protein IEO21_01691 [Postia placenta]
MLQQVARNVNGASCSEKKQCSKLVMTRWLMQMRNACVIPQTLKLRLSIQTEQSCSARPVAMKMRQEKAGTSRWRKVGWSHRCQWMKNVLYESGVKCLEAKELLKEAGTVPDVGLLVLDASQPTSNPKRSTHNPLDMAAFSVPF